MTKIKNFFLNGQLYYVEETITISDLINYFNFKDSLLVLEYNNLICDKKNLKEILILALKLFNIYIKCP